MKGSASLEFGGTNKATKGGGGFEAIGGRLRMGEIGLAATSRMILHHPRNQSGSEKWRIGDGEISLQIWTGARLTG